MFRPDFRPTHAKGFGSLTAKVTYHVAPEPAAIAAGPLMQADVKEGMPQ